MSAASAKAWRLANPELARAHSRAYHRRHHDRSIQRSRTKARKRYAERKALIDGIKLASGCIDCGYNTHPEALEFDHVTGIKLFHISACKTRSWAAILAEIDKCEVRCANCHVIQTVTRQRAVR